MRISSLIRWTIASSLGVAWLASPAFAQEAISTIAPTQPGVGGVVTKSQLRINLYGSDPTGRGRSGVEHELFNEAIVGITPRLSASLGVPLIQRNLSSDQPEHNDDRSGMGDLSLMLKYRLWQDDPGPVDTRRLAVFAGTSAPTGTSGLSSGSWDPFAGAVFMVISGRHGFNQSLAWTFTTGAMDDPVRAGDTLADVFSFDSAYLYRLAPADYPADLKASLYAVIELNGTLETNGDLDIRLSPGLLYEAASFALEAGVQAPVVSEIDRRMRLDLGIRLGLRILF